MEAIAQAQVKHKDDVIDSKGFHRDHTVEVADGPINKAYLDELAMAEEIVDVMVHESTDPNAENPVWVSCNGVNQFFYRGQTQSVKRKFLEILAHAKRTAISTPESTNHNGERTTLIRKSSALAYPFSVVQDRNPNGAAWLRRMLSQP